MTFFIIPEIISSMSEVPSAFHLPVETPASVEQDMPQTPGALLEQVFKEVTEQHTGRRTNIYGRKNDYGNTIEEFVIHGTHGDVHLGVGTRDPLFRVGDFTLMFPLAPRAVARGLYVVPEGRHKKSVVYRARSIDKLLIDQGITDAREVVTKILVGLQHATDSEGKLKPYEFSKDLRDKIHALGIEGFSEESQDSLSESTVDASPEQKEVEMSHKAENFRAPEDGEYFPERIVEETSRVVALREIIGKATAQVSKDDPREQVVRRKVAERLFDLVIHNAYGNIFPPVNSAGDAIGIPDEVHGDQYENSVSLILRKDHTLAPPGGFNDMGEALTQTIAREDEEETNEKLSETAILGTLSDPARDGRFTVVATVAAGITDPTKLLHALDDASEIIIVPLSDIIDQNGNLTSFSEPGTYTDITGKEFTHNGFFAGHDKTFKMLHEYWQQHGKAEGLTLSQTIKKMSSTFPQEWFGGYKKHPAGTDTYKVDMVNGKNLLMTPNVVFAWQQATKIFTEAGMSPDVAATAAKEFVYNAVNAKVAIDGKEQTVELLPKFPQPSVAADCLLVTGRDHDQLLVKRRANGELVLGGSFYSPEHTEAGKSLEQFITNVVASRFHTNLVHPQYVGPVGGNAIRGEYADKRSPRITHVYTEFVPDDVALDTTGFPDGSELVKIPIWADDTHTTFSKEITEGKWGFDHNEEIVQPLLRGALTLLAQQEPRIVPVLTKDALAQDSGAEAEAKGLSPEVVESPTDLLSRFLIQEPGNPGAYRVDLDLLKTHFTEPFVTQIIAGNVDEGIDVVQGIFTAIDALKSTGATILVEDEESRTLDQILVAEGMNAIYISAGLDEKIVTQSYTDLRRIGMKRLEAIGILKPFPQVKPTRNLLEEINTPFRETHVREVTYTREFAILMRDFHIESETSRNGVSELLSGKWDKEPKKIIFVAGNNEREMLFHGMSGSEVHKYTTPIEIDAIRQLVEEEIARVDPEFQFKKVVSLSMGAAFAGTNPRWLDDFTPYLKKQIAEGGVFLLGSTDSKLAGPLLAKIKELGGKSIGVVPEGPVVFPGNRQDNLDNEYPAAAIPADITIVVQSGKDYDGSESPYFVQVALTEALAVGRTLDIGMINGGKLTLLDEVARLLDEESRKDGDKYPELGSTLMLVKDAGRGSQLLSVLIERERAHGKFSTSVDALIKDMESVVGQNHDTSSSLAKSPLFAEFGLRTDTDTYLERSLATLRTFLKELTKETKITRGESEITIRPYAVALEAALKACRLYTDRHQLGDAAISTLTTAQIRDTYAA